MTKPPQPRMEINLEEIYQILDSARRQPMSEAEYEKVKTAVTALAEKAAPRFRTTERTHAVLPDQNPDKPTGKIRRRRASRPSPDTDAIRDQPSLAPTGLSWRMPRFSLVTNARNVRKAKCIARRNPKR